MAYEFEKYEMDPDSIISTLQRVGPFSHLSSSVLRGLLPQFETLFVPSQTVIIKEGEKADELFIVFHGLLSVFTEKSGFVAEVGSGEVVGEVGLLVDLQRTASVKTIRDSILLKLKKHIFESYTKERPIVYHNIAKDCIRRLSTRGNGKDSAVKTIALIPISKDPGIREFIRHVYMMLYREGNTLLVNREMIPEKFKKADTHGLLPWLNDQELLHKYILYEGDHENNKWTQLCIRQADAVFFVCNEDDEKNIRDVEKLSFTSSHKGLLILHSKREEFALGTRDWIVGRNLSEFHHIHPSDPASVDKAARIISRKARGLVLSGGGARGAAHIGLIRALEELNIPIDLIGGTSSGAIMAALYSIGYDSKILQEKYAEIMVKGSRLDFTFPYLSIAKGRIIDSQLKKYSGEEGMIEDLWTRFFCVSTNMTKNKEQVHDEGKIWRALRASASLPGIYPPVLEGEDLLIDGGIVNNLPVDLMKDRFFAGSVIASLVSASEERIEMNVKETTISGWRILLNNLNPFRMSNIRCPRIDSMIMSGLNVTDSKKLEDQMALADKPISIQLNNFSIMDYKKYEKIIEEGYIQSIEQLGELF